MNSNLKLQNMHKFYNIFINIVISLLCINKFPEPGQFAQRHIKGWLSNIFKTMEGQNRIFDLYKQLCLQAKNEDCCSI